MIPDIDKDKIDNLNKKRNLFMSEYLKVISLNDRFEEVYEHAKKAKDKQYPIDMKLLGGESFWGAVFHTKIGSTRVDFPEHERRFWETDSFAIAEQYAIAREVMDARLDAFNKYNVALMKPNIARNLASVSVTGDERYIGNLMRQGTGQDIHNDYNDGIPSIVIKGSDYHKNISG